MTERERKSHKTFPPGLRNLQIPTASRGTMRAGLALYAPCRPRGIALQRAAWIGVGLFGAAAIPSRRSPFRPPVPGDVWEGLRHTWTEEFGRFDATAVYARTQAEREGFLALLLRGGEPLAFLKCRPVTRGDLSTERAAVEAMTEAAPRSFRVPAALAEVVSAGWTTLAYEPLPAVLHRPPRRAPVEAVAAEIERALRVLPRPPGAPDHWEPAHGDLTPWNLRQLPGGPLVLVDWEEAGWAPPGADVVLYRATAAAVLGEDLSSTVHGEAVAYWTERLEAVAPGERRDSALRMATLRALRLMRSAGHRA